jgi:hypothetical protein
MFRTKVVEKIKTHILCSVTLFRKSCRLWDNVEKYGTARQTGHRWQYYPAHALCVPDWLWLQTHRICKVMSGRSPQLLRMCCANFSKPATRCADFLKPATGSSTMHTVAVNATTAASGAKYSERCDPQTQRKWQHSVLSRNTISLRWDEVIIFPRKASGRKARLCLIKSSNQSIRWLFIQIHNVTNMAVIGKDCKSERLVWECTG